MTDLARFCDVPERTLHRHFVAFVGHPPLAHFRGMRLAAAREALLAPRPDTSTTDIATRFGFAHLGRFAAEYRRRFGEAPSATLARGRGITADARTVDHLAVPHLSRRRDAPVIAVHSFQTEGGCFELRRLAEAVSEQISGALARNHGFAVRLVRPAPDGRGVQPSDARYGLTGRVVRLPGGTVRVLTALRDLADGSRHLWGDAHDGTVEQLPQLQDRIAHQVVRATRQSIDAAEMDSARRKPPGSLRAHDLVLRALPFILAADPTSARAALGPLEQAMGLDPDDPRPVALASWCRAQLLLYDGTAHPDAERVLARQLADRAAALDPCGDPLVLTARSGGAIAANRCDQVDALLARAGAVDPGFGWVWERKGWLRAIHGEPEAALACFRRAMQLKGPRAPIANCLAGIGKAHFVAGRFEEAARWMNRALSENPAAVWLNRVLAPCYLAFGEQQSAARSLDLLRRAYPGITLARVEAALPGIGDSRCDDTQGRLLEGLTALGLPA
ncbi:helix-turn-helix domain-containing protein [Roseomonas fluvialis]|uniref:helix-turn-helix domain-containing protein n=1 Tax=Roseomonas fluvialis TaxID=1750527 RepID=UPI0024341415|nr:helix-turn-helix domain-containing protein [Roseomonas fluvialis]